MCIRDSNMILLGALLLYVDRHRANGITISQMTIKIAVIICLLYTSDAADERSSVDLGGRRIIKKKKHKILLC